MPIALHDGGPPECPLQFGKDWRYLVNCGGRCVEPLADIDNCGGCGVSCAAVAPSAPACAGGRCLLPRSAEPSPLVPKPTPGTSRRPNAVVRESQTVPIDGVDEHWRLEWQRAPEPACIGEFSCYCNDFSYGEKGDLDLVRQRPGQPEDRLHLTPLMGEEVYDSPGHFHKGKAILVRWPATGPDFEHVPSLTELGARRSASVMQFADYDHDGRATEFKVLIWNFAPCALGRLAIVVGIDRKNTKLHAFSTAESPRTPMTLRSESWEEVRRHVPTTVVESGCGNHGSMTEYSSSIRVDARGLHIVNRQRECDP